MYNIDTADSVGSMPVISSRGNPGWFSRTTPFTTVSTDWGNIIQAELLNVLSAANITPNKTQSNQLLTSMQSLFSSRSVTSFSITSPPSEEIFLNKGDKIVINVNSAINDIELFTSIVSDACYRITVASRIDTGEVAFQLLPNSTLYTSAFSSWGIQAVAGTLTVANAVVGNSFIVPQSISGITSFTQQWIINTATHNPTVLIRTGFNNGIMLHSSVWTNGSNSWNSLGQLNFLSSVIGIISIERIL